jgi:hypothetical protein
MTSRMQDYLPKYYDDSQIVTEMMSAETAEFDALNAEQYKTLDQFFVSTSTYALDRWERVLALPPAHNASVEFRRKRILAKLAGNAPATVQYLTDLVNVYVPKKDAEIVEHSAEYRFEAKIHVNENKVDPVAISDAVNEIKPAHLAFMLTLNRTMDATLNFGGIISTRNKTQIRPAAFKQPPIQQTKYYAGFISMRTKTVIKSEV